MRHLEISRSKKPLAPPGLRGEGKGIRFQSPLRTGVLEAVAGLDAARVDRYGDGAEKSRGERSLLSLSSFRPNQSPPASQEHGQCAPGCRTGQRKAEKDPEEGTCRIWGTGTHLTLTCSLELSLSGPQWLRPQPGLSFSCNGRREQCHTWYMGSLLQGLRCPDSAAASHLPCLQQSVCGDSLRPCVPWLPSLIPPNPPCFRMLR